MTLPSPKEIEGARVVLENKMDLSYLNDDEYQAIKALALFGLKVLDTVAKRQPPAYKNLL